MRNMNRRAKRAFLSNLVDFIKKPPILPTLRKRGLQRWPGEFP
jgi:hypothetical protein